MFLADAVKVVTGTNYSCGDIKNFVFDGQLPLIISTIITIIMIAVPILLIIFGMLDLGKAVMAQKEDEIKKGQQTFLKRLVAAAIVFFVIFIVKMVIGLVAPADKGIAGCIECFVNGNCVSVAKTTN